MEWFRLNALSVGSITSTILLVIIFVYLFSLKNKTHDTWYLTGYLGSLFLLLSSYTFRYFIFSHIGIITGHISNLIVFGVFCLIQFSYNYKRKIFKKESKIFFYLFLITGLIVWIIQLFKPEMKPVYDFQSEYFTYIFDPSISIVTLTGYIWSFIILIRKTIYLSKLNDTRSEKRNIIRIILKPSGRSAVSSRSFAILSLFTASLAVFYLLFTTELISRFTYAFIFNISSLIICLFIFITYLNNTSQSSSFIFKVVGIPLATILVSFGIVTIALTNVLKDTLFEQYRNESKLTLQSMYTQTSSLTLSEVTFIIPVSDNDGTVSYYNPVIDSLIIESIDEKIRETEALDIKKEPGFFYIDLFNIKSFFFYYKQIYNEQLYYVGFNYSDYRQAIHNFIIRIVIILAITTIFILLLFPIIFRKNLLNPLKRILGGVRQVEAGNYRMEIMDFPKDEIGQLANGYNMMVNSLKNAEGNFKALTENANDAILIISKNGKIIYANTKASELSGYKQFMLYKKNIYDFLIQEKGNSKTKSFIKKLEIQPECFETTFFNKAGTSIPVEATGAKTNWQNQDADAIILRDISERKKSEELLRNQEQQILKADKLASLGALVGSVAHEIKNPNQIISLHTNFLSEGITDLLKLVESPEQADENYQLAGLSYDEFKKELISTISEISKSTIRINRIVEELKHYIRGNKEVSKTITDVNYVIHSVVNISQHFIHKATNNFELNLSSDLPEITADKIQIEQVVLNLIQNACQALQDKNRRIIVTTTYNESGGFINICIEDEGAGISNVDINDITKPFFTTKRDIGGTGLGLYVSNTIVKEHGGTLSFISQQDKGTIATVSLPVRKNPHI